MAVNAIHAPPINDAAVRVPPHNYDAEQALLGAIFMDNRVYEEAAEFLKPEHFADPFHGRIFKACGELIARQEKADPVKLKRIFADDQGLADMGGDAYLARLAASAISTRSAGDYARLIYGCHHRRELIALGEDLVYAAYDMRPDLSSEQIQEDIEARLFQLTEGVSMTDTTVPLSAGVDSTMNFLEEIWKADGRLVGVTTGLHDLDAKLGGLHETDLIILAGRPSMGKTALGLNIAEAAIRSGVVTAFYSLEMSTGQLVTRLLSSTSGIEGSRIREGRLSAMERVRVAEASLDIKSLPLHIEDATSLTIPQLRTRARRLKRRHGLGLIVVDYLQLMRGTSTSRDSNRVQEISEISRGLKSIAKELKVPVLALSQLSRQVEQREDKRPQLADLRESGSIEQDADVVMFVYREEYYLERSEPDPSQTKKWEDWNTRHEAARNLAEVIIGKQRHGPTGTVKLFFNGNLTKFGDLAHQHRPGDL